MVEPSAALLELSLLRLRHPDFAGRAKFAKQDDGGSYVAHFSLQRVQVARAAGDQGVAAVETVAKDFADCLNALATFFCEKGKEFCLRWGELVEMLHAASSRRF